VMVSLVAAASLTADKISPWVKLFPWPCHPERREGSALAASHGEKLQIPRFARNDKSKEEYGSHNSFHFHILRILEWQKCHEVGVMHDVGLGGAFYQITFGGMGGDNVADLVWDATFQR